MTICENLLKRYKCTEKTQQIVQKGQQECRFYFPRPPAQQTTIVRNKTLRNEGNDDENVREQEIKQAKERLARLTEYLKEGNFEMNFLDHSGYRDYEQYLNDMSMLSEKTNILCLCARGVEDAWVNHYNPDLLRIWNNKKDVQYVTDPLACVMYIVSYIKKGKRSLVT